MQSRYIFMFFARIKEGCYLSTAAGWHLYHIIRFRVRFRSFQRILCKGVASFDRTVMKLNTKKSWRKRWWLLWLYEWSAKHFCIGITDFHSKNSRGTLLYRTSYTTRRSISLPVHAMLAFVPRSKHRQLQPKKLGEFFICSI